MAGSHLIYGGELFHCSNFDVGYDGHRSQLVMNRFLARENGLNHFL